jgi:glutamate-ammonia-ligase adenylyltransferase
MTRSLAIRWAGTWPRAGDRAAAARLADRFAELGRGAAAAASQPPLADVLGSLGGNSPFLADLALREADTLRAVLRRGPDAVVADRLEALVRVPKAAPHARIAAALRQAKRQIALTVAVADIGDAWRLEQVCAALSALAEAALQLATDHLLLAAHRAGTVTLRDPQVPSRGCGFAVLAMGKLGARELNYSSDIDLVLLYDPDAHPTAAASGAISGAFTRLARALAGLMEARDADGYVFRTDFRLRPDPAATPPAVAMPAALTYYESMGQTWERLAMIKARPVAGDIALGTRFLEAIRPFIWRRHLDFAAIADIQGMKRRIDCHRGSALSESPDPVERIAGHNLKLGEGGIREVEFLAQTLQMVWGGRDPGLRDPTTLGALRRLATAGKMAPRAIAELAAAYRFLRRTEHRLQMVADRQTHSLPKGAGELEQFARFMAFDSAAGFADVLLRHLGRVRRHFSLLFEYDEQGKPDELDFRGDGEAAKATLAAVAALGFDNPQGVVGRVRGWLEGQVRALRSQRSRDLMEMLLPMLLASLARQPQPDVAFARFDGLLSRLPASVQLLSLLQRNHTLLDRIAAVLGAAPALADHLATTPSAMEGLLSPADIDLAPARALASQLGDASDLEGTIAITRRFVRGEEFRLSVRLLEGQLGVDADGAARTAVADAALGALLPRVMAEFAGRHGRVRGGGLVIVALGKAGGREMMAGSDLDLMLLYDHADGVLESHGPAGVRRFAPSQYFIRASHALVAAITAPGVEGPLYNVDMRLRPSGNKGPVAVSLAGFQRYHDENAWTWERMALTRARVVAGPARLRAAVSAALRTALTVTVPPERVRADAAAMRARLARDLPPRGPWDVKHRSGGLMEVEFISQVLQLQHGAVQPKVFSANTCTALARLRDAGLLPADEAAALILADRLWRGVQGTLRIAIGPRPVVDLPDPAAQALLSALRPIIAAPGLLDLKALHATMDSTAAQVRELFISHIGVPHDQAIKGNARQ